MVRSGTTRRRFSPTFRRKRGIKAIGSYKKSHIEEEFLLQVRALQLPLPNRNVRFARHLGRQFEADFLWDEPKVIVEIQGGLRVAGKNGGSVNGHHTTMAGYTADCEKLALATLLGYKVFWATSSQVKTGQAVAWVEEALGLRPIEKTIAS